MPWPYGSQQLKHPPVGRNLSGQDRGQATRLSNTLDLSGSGAPLHAMYRRPPCQQADETQEEPLGKQGRDRTGGGLQDLRGDGCTQETLAIRTHKSRDQNTSKWVNSWNHG